MNKTLKILTVFNICMIVIILITLAVMGCTKHTDDTTADTETTTTEMEEFDFSISNEWRSHIKQWEGFTSTAVNDCGYWAVGYGHQVCPVTEPKPQPVTREEAERLFEEDLHAYDEYIVAWAEHYGVELTRPVYEAFVSFCFQFGWRTGYMYGENWWGDSLASYLKGECTFEDFLEEARLYCKVNGVPNDAIRQRRIAEAEHILGKEVK